MGPLPRPDRFTGLALLEPGACALRQAPLMVMEAMEPGAYGACWTGPTTRARATRLGASIATDDQPREWEVPRSRFWPRSEIDQLSEITDLRDPLPNDLAGASLGMFDDDEWSEEFGLHPSSGLWRTSTVMMIRNIPGRCLERELESLIIEVTTQFRLEMPRRPHGGKCKGYAFVTVTSAQTMKELAEFFWRRRLHNRGSGRAFKIHPAKHQPSVSTPPPGFPGRVFGYLTNPGHIYWEI